MNESDLFYTLALLKVEGVGDILAKKLLQHCCTAREIFTAKKQELLTIDGIGEIVFRKLQDKKIFELAETEMKFIEKNVIRVMYYQEEAYPQRLQHCVDGPVLLFQSGKINWQQSKIISIVGTRQISGYGVECCRKLITDLAPLCPVIVSGFAYGTDITAQLSAIENNLQTVAVLGHGLNQIYPKAHQKYTASVLENGGFVTEFWSSSNPDRENFVRRNRIVAGISEATIVIESAEKGGSMITAMMANDYNRDVFAIPGRTTDRYSSGCNRLIKTQRANLLTSAADLIYLLNWEVTAKPKVPVQKQLFVNLEPDEHLIYNFLQQNGKTLLDSIALECGMPVYKLSGMLITMELKGAVRPLPGKLFEAI